MNLSRVLVKSKVYMSSRVLLIGVFISPLSEDVSIGVEVYPLV